VRASDRRQQRFADVLRSLATLARLGALAHTGADADRELHDVRRTIAQSLGEAQRLLEESKFEAEAGELEAFQRSVGDAQVIFSCCVARVSAPCVRTVARGPPGRRSRS